MNRSRFRAALGATAITATIIASGGGLNAASASGAGTHHAAVGQHASGSGAKDKREDKGSEDGGHGKGSGGKGDHGKGDHGKGDHGKGDQDGRKLTKAVAKQDAAFGRVLKRANKLDPETYALVAQNIAADRARLAGLTTVADVRALQPQNYQRVIAWLGKLGALTDGLATQDAAIDDAVAALVEQLLLVDADSDRAVLRAVHALLDELTALIEAAGEDDGDDAGDDAGDDGTDDGTGTGTGTGTDDGTGTGTDTGDDTGTGA